MTSLKRVGLLIILAAIAGTGLSKSPLFAQEQREGIGISPTTLTLSVNPGEKKEGQFTVLNSGTSAVRYGVYVSDFGIRNEEYEKNFESIPGVSSPTSWFTLPKGTRELAAGGQEKLNYAINVPASTVPQGYYAVIFAETAVPEVDATGVARIKRVGSLVYLTVNGGSISKGEFLSFGTPFWNRQKVVKPNVRVQNSGNVHIDVSGEVRLTDIFGRTMSQQPISGTLLPQTIRKFTPELSVGLPLGLYRVEGEVTVLGQAVNLGPRWVLVGSPLWLGLLIVVVAAWIFVLISWVKRRGRRKKA